MSVYREGCPKHHCDKENLILHTYTVYIYTVNTCVLHVMAITL